MKYETIDAEQIEDIMNGLAPREPKGWQGGDDNNGTPTAPVEVAESAEKPIGGPAAEH
jgi:cell division protease FtsH